MPLITCRNFFYIKIKAIVKIIKILKFSAVFMLVFYPHANAKGYPQNISISKNNVSLKEVFRDIKKQTGNTFVYKEALLHKAEKGSIKISGASVEQVPDECSKSQQLAFTILNHMVVIREKDGDAQEDKAFNSPLAVPPIKVTGKVTDDDGDPLGGATVNVKGTQTSTVTDPNGDFAIVVPDNGGVLIFSYIGFETVEVAVSKAAELNISLKQKDIQTEEVVVVGYGTQKKVNLTGAVSTISSKELTQRPVGQASAALQGMAPGVTVVQRSGKPGGDQGTIRIRGVGTIGAGQEPLVLVDGIEAPLNSVDPNLIQSISILKDAASASIYGSRAANGVILVTTKRARANQLSFNYNAYAGLQTPTNLPHMANAIDHMILTNEAYVNVGRAPLYSQGLVDKYAVEGAGNNDLYPNTDWQKEVLTGSGLMQNHFFSLNGGSDKIRFLTSFGYFDQKGFIESSGFKRFTLRNNVDVKFSEQLSAQFDLQLVNAVTTEPGRGTEEVFHWMNRIPANQIGINSKGTWGEGWNGDNPIAMTREGGFRKGNNPSASLNASLVYKPVNWLSAEIRVAPRYSESFDKNFNRAIQTYKPDGTKSFLAPARTTLTESSNRALFNNFRGTLTFDRAFGDNGIKVLAGASREDFSNNFVSAFRDNFILPDYPILNTGSAANQQASGNGAEWALQSFFGRVNYDYKEKYLLEINGRYDGSSRFAEGRKYGFFPSFSAGWRLSEEKFMQPLKGVIDEFKIRGSWGRLGNQNIGNYPFASIMNIGVYTFARQIVSTAALNNMANPNISWETTEMTNIGFDATLFSSKLTITAEYYSNQSRDILLNLNIPLIVGLNAPAQNAGKVNNKGWDLGIGYRSAINKFKYDVTVNVSDVKNRIVDLKGINQSSLTQNREGYSINSIYGLVSEGLFQKQAEVDASAKQFGIIKPGDIKYKDQNNDGIINDNDNVIIGSTIPRYTYSSNINAGYKGFTLNIFLQGVGKANGYLYQQGIMPFFLGGTVQEQHKNRWTSTNTNAVFPRLAFSEANNEKNSTFWMKDASYLRLKNLQIGYNVPLDYIAKSKIKGLRFFLSGSNLFTRDNFWNGYDVEAPVGTGNQYPQVKLYTLGVDVNF
ncbi:MAG: TonB-dependent receptor [Chitinophagaceae bacterium]